MSISSGFIYLSSILTAIALASCNNTSAVNPPTPVTPTTPTIAPTPPPPTVTPTPLPTNPLPVPGINYRGQIQFAPGATTASVNNFINPSSIDRYTFEATANQPTSIQINSSTGQVLLTLIGPDGSPIIRSQSGASSWSGTLPQNGTYILDAVNNYIGTQYSVSLNIQPASGGGGAQINYMGPIKFPPGGTFASINGNLAPRNIDRYTFQANGGQAANLTINSPNRQVLLTLVDPNGVPLIRYQSGATRWSGRLPATGTYRVDAVNQSTPSGYSLNLSITP